MRGFVLLACLLGASCAPDAAGPGANGPAAMALPGLDDAGPAARVPPTDRIRTSNYEGLTPTTVRGGRVIGTAELQRLMQSSRPVLVDVLNDVRTSLPGAVLLTGAGEGTAVNDALQRRFTRKLASLTGGDLDRPVVFFCLSQTCWLSHNAVVRAVAAGYRDVYWYRGGHTAWLEAGLPMRPVRASAW